MVRLGRLGCAPRRGHPQLQRCVLCLPLTLLGLGLCAKQWCFEVEQQQQPRSFATCTKPLQGRSSTSGEEGRQEAGHAPPSTTAASRVAAVTAAAFAAMWQRGARCSARHSELQKARCSEVQRAQAAQAQEGAAWREVSQEAFEEEVSQSQSQIPSVDSRYEKARAKELARVKLPALPGLGKADVSEKDGDEEEEEPEDGEETPLGEALFMQLHAIEHDFSKEDFYDGETWDVDGLRENLSLLGGSSAATSSKQPRGRQRRGYRGR
mmetsp:Transcript_63234/g.150815  ORF Transcript_63234/g.150815 Transcript_63234/m.150815 type:complete len:266 (+) Transcript_63234:132-929(+)